MMEQREFANYLRENSGVKDHATSTRDSLSVFC